MKYANNLGLLVGLAAITLVGCSKELPATVAATPQKSSSSAEAGEPLVGMVDQAAEFHRSRAADLEELTFNTATIAKQDEQKRSNADLQQEDSESVGIANTKSVRAESSSEASVETTEYLVRSGDTLGTIADRHSTTVAALVSANAIDNPNEISVGQAIRITL